MKGASVENIICDLGSKEEIENDTDQFVSRNKNGNNNNFFRVKFPVFVLIWAYFIWATYYQFSSKPEISVCETTCTGYGFLLIMFCFFNYGFLHVYILKPYFYGLVNKYVIQTTTDVVRKLKYGSLIFYAVFCIALLIFLIIDTSEDRTRLIPISGLVLFVLVGFLLSPHKTKIPWHTVAWGIILQFTLGLLTIKWSVGRNIFDCAGDKVNTFLNYAQNGSAFVYGEFLVFEKQVFAFTALTTIFFLSFFINILYYYGIMQTIVGSLGSFLQWIMGTTICESVNSAANIFLGQTEAPLLLKPYLKYLTDSELHSIMTSGFATVSGTVLAAYIIFGANPRDLITASIMSAPAALCYSKLMYPETEEPKMTKENIELTEIEFDSVLDAASKGATDAFKMVTGIIASLIAFIAFICFVNGVLAWMGMLVGYTSDIEQWSVELIVGKIFIPVSYVMGVPWQECEKVGQLIGIKTMVNEFVAFREMSKMTLSPRSKVIATYAICGFSNPASIGVQISGLSALIPDKTKSITRLVFRAFLGGAFTCFMTACVAGLLY